MISEHDISRCYDNIEKVKLGDTRDEAIKKMKSKMIWFKFQSEPCFHNHENSRDLTTITFPYEDKNDPLSSQPNFCYSNKTNKIMFVSSGLFY